MSGPVPFVVLAGAAGTGKTELGLRLARSIRAALLDLDTLTGPLTEALLARGASLDDVRAQRYSTLTDAALEVAGGGVAVIAAAPWTRELQDVSWYRALEERAARTGSRLTVLWLRPALPQLRARLASRGLARDAAKLADWDRWSRDLHRIPRVRHTALDMATRLSDLVDEAAAGVRATT